MKKPGIWQTPEMLVVAVIVAVVTGLLFAEFIIVVGYQL